MIAVKRSLQMSMPLHQSFANDEHRWMVNTVAIFLSIVFATVARGQDFFVSMAKDHWASGQQIEFLLFPVNGETGGADAAPRDSLTCILSIKGRTYSVLARRIAPENEDTIDAPKTVAPFRYAFNAPDRTSGTIRMKIVEIDCPPVLFDIVSPKEGSASEADYTSLDAFFLLYQPYLKNIGAYEPMYFLVGTEPEKSKFQISFKYRFFNPESVFSTRHHWLNGFHLGYTQTSFWDLASSSAPFEDTSYKPELFWLSNNFVTGDSTLKGLFLQTGGQHESNGLGGEESRSTNYLYVKPVFIFYWERFQSGLQVAPKVWAYVGNDDETNADLDDYRGYFDLGLKLGNRNGFVLASSFRWAKKGASIRLDLTYPLHRLFFKSLEMYFQLQYANELAERLIAYDERSHAFRLGFSIVR